MVLSELVVLLRDQASLVGRIGFDVSAVAPEMTSTAERLRQARAVDEAVRMIAGARERRNRIYALTGIQIADIRAYAQYAFRDDPTDQRRSAFSSSWLRSRNRAARQRKAGKEPEATTPTAPATGEGTDPSSQPDSAKEAA